MDPQATLDVMHRLMIRREAALWIHSGRAIHAFRLRKIYREAGWSVPEEIEVYLDACDQRLCEDDLSSPAQVSEAFGLDRKGRNAHVSSDQLTAAELVLALKAMHLDWSRNKLLNHAAKHLNDCGDRLKSGKDAGSYVRDAYDTWRRIIQKTR